MKKPDFMKIFFTVPRETTRPIYLLWRGRGRLLPSLIFFWICLPVRDLFQCQEKFRLFKNLRNSSRKRQQSVCVWSSVQSQVHFCDQSSVTSTLSNVTKLTLILGGNHSYINWYILLLCYLRLLLAIHCATSTTPVNVCLL